jgi:ribonuclease P protein component
VVAQQRPQDGAPGRLTRRAEFLAVAAGQRTHTALLTLQARPRSDAPDAAARLGLTITRKAGGAVERNRMRRRLRAALRQVASGAAQPGHDYVIVARSGVIHASFNHLLADIQSAFRRVHTAKPGKGAAQTPRG